MLTEENMEVKTKQGRQIRLRGGRRCPVVIRTEYKSNVEHN
jgi:hypothetical protein